MIKPKFNMGQIRRDIELFHKRIDASIISRLSYIGETFVNNARANGKYIDQTGNLRSSIGYIVQKDGKQKSGSFLDRYAASSEGQKSGAAFIKSLRAKYDTGYVLICVAGMDYAAAVESKGKDVLTGSSIIAKKQLSNAFKSFKS